ncbi:MAG: O-antigen ligase family protein, partial [Chloroflexota bacterium]
NVGLFLGRCLPFATAFMLMTSDRRMRVLWAGAVFVMLFAIALSQSAGAIFLGVPAALALVLVLVWRRRAWIPLAGMAIILILGLVFALQMPRFARALDFDQGTNFYRVRVWQSTINVIEDHPITGLGLDQFLYAFRGTYIMPDAWEEPNLSHPHNILLDQWVRLGIAGVGLLVAMQIVFWRRTFKYYQQIIHHRSQQNRLMLVLAVGIMASMFNLLVHGMVDHSIYVTDLAVVFALLLGLAVNLPEVGAAGDSR